MTGHIYIGTPVRKMSYLTGYLAEMRMENFTYRAIERLLARVLSQCDAVIPGVSLQQDGEINVCCMHEAPLTETSNFMLYLTKILLYFTPPYPLWDILSSYEGYIS